LGRGERGRKEKESGGREERNEVKEKVTSKGVKRGGGTMKGGGCGRWIGNEKRGQVKRQVAGRRRK